MKKNPVNLDGLILYPDTNNPKVKIPTDFVGEGRYVTNRGEWDMSTLRDATIGLDVFDLQLAALDLDIGPWHINTIALYLYHAKRVEDTNLKYPIIMSPAGFIIDGWHRVVKAILAGKTEIKAVRLLVMPEPDAIKTE